MKKTISVLFAVFLTGMTMMSPCLAADQMNGSYENIEGTEVPYNLAIYNPRADCWREENSVSGYVTANYYSEYTAQMTVNVQRSTDKVNWLKAGSLGTVSGTNGKLSLSGDFPAISGYYYRLAATVTVYDGSTVVESLTFYSSVV